EEDPNGDVAHPASASAAAPATIAARHITLDTSPRQRIGESASRIDGDPGRGGKLAIFMDSLDPLTIVVRPWPSLSPARRKGQSTRRTRAERGQAESRKSLRPSFQRSYPSPKALNNRRGG